MVKKVRGVGIMDSNSSVNNKKTEAYNKWIDMLGRCYSERVHTRRPNYSKCTVCDEWLTFSVFEEWFNKNNIVGHHLDKDILVEGNTVYSPTTCCFVPRYINNLFSTRERSKGTQPIGVLLETFTGKYKAAISINGRPVNLGRYDSPEQAHKEWLKAKREYCRKIAIDSYMKDEIDEQTMNAIIKKAYGLC